MELNDVQYHKDQASLAYAEAEQLEHELKTTTVQHKRQALKTKITEKRLQWQLQNMMAQNAALKVDALKIAMAQQVKVAQYTLEESQKSIAEAGITLAHRLEALAANLRKNVELGRYEDICYNISSDLVVTVGNSSLDSLSRRRAEMLAAQQILAIADGSKS